MLTFGHVTSSQKSFIQMLTFSTLNLEQKMHLSF